MTKTDTAADQHTSQDQEHWFGGRRWAGYAAIGFVVVVLLCAAVLILVNRDGTPVTGQGGVTPPAAGGQSSVITSLGDGTETGPTDPRVASPSVATEGPAAVVPTAAPAGTSWQLVAGQAVPSQTGVGPAHVDGYTAWGYAHTPLGALYAAANGVYRIPIAVTADTDWEKPLQVMVAPGQGRDVLANLRSGMQPKPMGPDGAGIHQLAAFKFVSYTDGEAVIQLVLKDENAGLHLLTVPTRWLGGDWRLVMTDDGTIGGQNAVIDSLSGYVVWQGVS